MAIKRLWQPRHPLFWLMLLFNLLSSLCAWALRSWTLPDTLMLLIAAVALGNVFFGLRCALVLMAKPASSDRDAANT
jgi:4-hydroxybenzoate polyprenyltransferase